MCRIINFLHTCKNLMSKDKAPERFNFPAPIQELSEFKQACKDRCIAPSQVFRRAIKQKLVEWSCNDPMISGVTLGIYVNDEEESEYYNFRAPTREVLDFKAACKRRDIVPGQIFRRAMRDQMSRWLREDPAL